MHPPTEARGLLAPSTVIAPLLPGRGGRRGGQWRDHRTVINGILWRSRTGAPWRGLATRYEKRTANYRAMVVLASIAIWLES
jgi:transposase